MKAFGVARIGRDAEVRFTPDGQPVASLSLAFSFYDKTAPNNKGTAWVDASFWGPRAEKLAPHLTKGTQIGVTLQDVHIQEFKKKDGTTGSKIVARVSDVDLIAGPAPQRQEAPPPPPPKPRPAPAPSGFDDMSDDPPF